MAAVGTRAGSIQVNCPGCGEDVTVDLDVKSTMLQNGHLTVNLDPRCEHECPGYEVRPLRVVSR